MNDAVLIGIIGVWILVLEGSSLLYPHILRYRKTLWTLVGISVYGFLSYRIGEQYQIWHHLPDASFLLPPHTSITYFARYAGTRIILPYLISFMGAMVWYGGMRWLNRIYKEKFFYTEELFIAPITLFLMGYPGLVIYSISFILFFILYSILHTLWSPQSVSSSRYLWLPVAMCAILIQQVYLIHTSWWGLFKI